MSPARFHVVIPPAEEIEPPLLKQLAEVIGQTPYDLRLRLRSRTPRPCLSCEQFDEAEAVRRKLNLLDVATVLFAEHRLPPAPAFAVHTFLQTGNEFHFSDRHGETLIVGGDDIALIVMGKFVRTTPHDQVDVAETVGSTFPPSAAPRSGAHSITPARDLEAEIVTILFRPSADAPAIEMRQDEMDYAFLEDRREANSLWNQRLVQHDLKGALPRAAVDERLLDGHASGEGEAFYDRRVAGDPMLPHATLIHWMRMAEASEARHLEVV